MTERFGFVSRCCEEAADKLIYERRLHKRKDPVIAASFLLVSHAMVPDRTANSSRANHTAGNCTYSPSEVRKLFAFAPITASLMTSGRDVGVDGVHGTCCHWLHLIKQCRSQR